MKSPFALTLRGALCAFAAFTVISAARADDTKEKKVPPGALKKYDANQDGVLDEKEKAAWEADKAKAFQKRLEKWDANKDGKLDESELAAEKAARAEAKAKQEAAKEKKKKTEAGN